jgi:hypothetical protein
VSAPVTIIVQRVDYESWEIIGYSCVEADIPWVENEPWEEELELLGKEYRFDLARVTGTMWSERYDTVDGTDYDGGFELSDIKVYKAWNPWPEDDEDLEPLELDSPAG